MSRSVLQASRSLKKDSDKANAAAEAMLDSAMDLELKANGIAIDIKNKIKKAQAFRSSQQMTQADILENEIISLKRNENTLRAAASNVRIMSSNISTGIDVGETMTAIYKLNPAIQTLLTSEKTQDAEKSLTLISSLSEKLTSQSKNIFESLGTLSNEGGVSGAIIPVEDTTTDNMIQSLPTPATTINNTNLLQSTHDGDLEYDKLQKRLQLLKS